MPRLGKRILKSAIGVWICYLVQMLRGGNGIVFYSQLAVLWCIQPYTKDSLKNGLQRTIGTLIGAAYGLLVILLSHVILSEVFVNEGIYGMLVSFGVLIVLYTTVLLGKKNASYFSSVVFLSIVVNHIRDTNPLTFVANRVLDTMIGIVLGVGINMFRIPRKKQKDILFVSGVDDTILNEEGCLSAYSRIELNRMLDEGANFTISTMRTPASVIDALGGIHWKLPWIVMDGAALYDSKDRKFIKTVPLSGERVGQLKHFFDRMNRNCFINTVIDGMLVISYKELRTDTEKSIYDTLRKSPYRNFVRRDLSGDGDVLYFMAVGDEEEMDKVYEALKEEAFAAELKVQYYASTSYPGQMYMKIYDKDATRENMMEDLKGYLGIEKTLTFGSISGKYDIVVKAGDGNVVARTLERVYEPIFPGLH